MNSDDVDRSEEIKPLTASQLGELYPKAKTYDELEQRHKAAETERLKRQPKLVLITAGIIIAGVFTILLDAPAVASFTLGTFGIMAGVFASFFAGVVLFGLLVWQFGRIASYFADRSLAGSWFVWLYIFSGSITAWAYMTFAPDSNWSTRLGFSFVHMITMVLVGSSYALATKKQ